MPFHRDSLKIDSARWSLYSDLRFTIDLRTEIHWPSKDAKMVIRNLQIRNPEVVKYYSKCHYDDLKRKREGGRESALIVQVRNVRKYRFPSRHSDLHII